MPASGLISLQQSLIESNELNFMLKYHFDFLPTKLELAAPNNSWDIAIFVQSVESFSVGRISIHTRDLNPGKTLTSRLMSCASMFMIHMRDQLLSQQ